MVDLQRITERQNNVVITDRMWARLLSSTHQPSFLSAKEVIEDKKEGKKLVQRLDDEVCLGDHVEVNNEISCSSIQLGPTDNNK